MKRTNITRDYPIDFVVPWVDGSDPVWRAERAKYTADTNSDNSEERYREWGTLRYWFRAVERYAPWVRTIHFVTCGHLPAWLDTSNPKLHIVKHSDYIPAEYLPTFSSHTIELNLHRIEGLAEHFVYFNDDFYLNAPTEAEDFFQNGIPADTATFGVIKNSNRSNFMPYIMLNMMALVNEHFPKRAMLKRDWLKWLSPKNGKGVLNTLYLLPWAIHTGFRDYHNGAPYLRSTFEQVWREEGEVLDATCRRRFRSREDVNQYIMRYWQLCQGRFVPHRPQSAYYTVGNQSMQVVQKAMQSPKYKLICINDDPMGFDYESEKEALLKAFGEKFPERSSFEIGD